MAESGKAGAYVAAIRGSGKSIYDPVEVGDPALWIPAPDLERILDAALQGLHLGGLPLRTRSKVVKSKVCEALGYPVPGSFKKTQPRFPGQNFDTYVQKSSNLQIWNEEIASARRYVLIGVSADDTVHRVRVVDGDTLARLDTTGTLTQKYQARFVPKAEVAELVSPLDTNRLRQGRRVAEPISLFGIAPTSAPADGQLLPIAEVFARLRPAVGSVFQDAGADQERNRGAELHRIVCKSLGYSNFGDDGRFPDVRHQLLEVKLQTSPTIDLGLASPDDAALLDVTKVGGQQVRHCDVRYAVFYGEVAAGQVKITHLVVVCGQDFFSRFPRFEGRVLNKKLQIPLPRGFLGE